MEKFYRPKDIEYFLFDHDVLWKGGQDNKHYIDSGLNFKTIVVNLIEGKHWQEVIFQVDELNFQIFKEESETCYQDTTYSKKLLLDLSSEWIKYLVQKFPEASSLIKRIIASKMKELHENTEDAIKPLQKKINKIKQDEQAEMDHLRNLDVLVGEVFNLIK